MTDQPHRLPKLFDPDTAWQILDQANLILAPMLPGCSARRFDLQDKENPYWPVELCFADHGPIVPEFYFNRGKYLDHVGLNICYRSMFRDPRERSIAFPDRQLTTNLQLDLGPEAIAVKMHEAIGRVDLASLIAAGTAERLVVDRRDNNSPWTQLYLAPCAVYLEQDDEARRFLQNAIDYAKEWHSEVRAEVTSRARVYLDKLDTDPDTLRQELTYVMGNNWSHFRVVQS